jgi:PAS domain S-box-containing protein
MFTILYVDDEPGLLEVGKLFLEQGGQFSVETITSATEALKALRSGHYDAIISDYQMPGMDGIEFLKKVRYSGNTIPFIIFTGRGREEIVIQALNEGADFYLQKGGEPVSQFTELAHKVRQAVQQRMAEASIRDHERRETDIINFLPDATFAIDTHGVVIAWNRAMEMMTGVMSSEMLGRGDYEYAIPFYHERRPLLIDLVLRDDPDTGARYPYIKHDGKTFFSEITIPHFHGGRGAALWFTASPLYDTMGNVVGAIESIREITEWKQAEEALNESERRFRELADMLPQAVYEADAKGVLTYANRIAFELFGYTYDEVRQGLNVMQMIEPGDRERAASAIRAMLDRKGRTERDTAEYQAIRKDGRVFPVAIYSSPILLHDVVTGFRGIIVDITDRRLAEDTIRESEQKYRTVFETTGTATVLVENDGTISLANSEFMRLSGYQKDEIENRKKWTEFVVQEDLDRMLMQHRLRRQDHIHALTHYEFRFRTRSGEIRDIYLTIDVIPNTTKSVASLLDITKRKRAEDRLVAANQEYTNLLDQIQDVYYRSDTEGRLIKASRSWATLLGYDNLSECLGRNIADDFYLNPVERKLFLEAINHDGKVTDYEVTLKKKDGTPVLVSTSSHVNVDATGKVLGIEGTFRDISERKRQDHILRIQRDLGLALQVTHGMTETLDICLKAAIEISGLDSGGIYLVDGGSGALDLIVSQNLGGDFVRTVSYYPADSTNGQIVMAGKPVYTRLSLTGLVNTAIQKQEGLRASAIIPIVYKKRVIACLNMASHTLDEIPVSARIALETIATQIGTAVERIRADEALAESEQRYRNIVEDQTEFICRFLSDGTHIFVNDAYCRYFGLKRDEILGHRFRPDIPPEDRERMKRFFKSLTPEHSVDIIEHRIIMPDGSIRWQRWSDRAIFDDSGAITEYQSVGRDTTDKQEAEDALRRSEGQFRILAGLLDLIPASVTVHDLDGRFLYANEKTFEYHGYTPGEFYKINLHKLDVPESEQLIKEHFRQLKVAGELSFEAGHFRKDGTILPLLITVKNAEWDGRPVILSVATDITEHKKTEAALQQSEARYRTLLTSVNEGIWVIDSEGCTTYVNQKMAEMLGYTVEEMTGSPMYRFMDEKGREIAARNYPAYRKGIKEQVEFEFVKKDGTLITALVNNTSLFDSSGRFSGAMAAITDITERKRAEQVIREANRKISLLTSVTRHDVINKVSALRGFASVAMTKRPDPLIAGLLQKIDSAASSIAQQIEFTRSYQELNMKTPDWHRISEIINKQETDSISLSCTCDAEVFADPMIEQVFFNLIDNAIRHGEKVTAITVSCQPGPDNSLVITVEDNGCGVAPDQKELIFEKGYGKHTGFGLFLAREVLAITGITIRETGLSGEGARFEIAVPKGMYRTAPD